MMSNPQQTLSAAEATVEVSLAEGKLVCNGILDSGADATIIPKTIADKLSQIDIAIVLQPISERTRIIWPKNGQRPTIGLTP